MTFMIRCGGFCESYPGKAALDNAACRGAWLLIISVIWDSLTLRLP